MKIGASPKNITAHLRQLPAGRESKLVVSFAEFLAAGNSVGAVRNQRALGFAETGVLGAARSLPRFEPKFYNLPGEIKVAIEPSATNDTKAGGIFADNKILHQSPGARPTLEVPTGPAQQGDGKVSQDAPEYKEGVSASRIPRAQDTPKAPNIAARAAEDMQKLLQRKYRSPFSVQIHDDSNVVDVVMTVGTGFTDEYHELLSDILTAARQFSVTLRAVTLNGESLPITQKF